MYRMHTVYALGQSLYKELKFDHVREIFNTSKRQLLVFQSPSVAINRRYVADTVVTGVGQLNKRYFI